MNAPNLASRNHWPRASFVQPRAFQVASCQAGSFQESLVAEKAAGTTAIAARSASRRGDGFTDVVQREPRSKASRKKERRQPRSTYVRTLTAPFEPPAFNERT